MQPWSRDEIDERLASAGFTNVVVRAGVPETRSDRLFVTASSRSTRHIPANHELA